MSSGRGNQGTSLLGRIANRVAKSFPFRRARPRNGSVMSSNI